MILYRCLVPAGDSGEDIVNAVRGFAADGTLSHVAALVSPDGRTVRLQSAEGQALAQIAALDEHEVAEMRVLGEFHSCLALTPMEETQESTFLCWEVLTAIAVFRPCAAWISDAAYSPADVQKVATVRRALFSDGGDGYLLAPSELARVVESI